MHRWRLWTSDVLNPIRIISITWFLDISISSISIIFHTRVNSASELAWTFLSLVGTFGQRNHQWIAGSASSHRPQDDYGHWRMCVCFHAFLSWIWRPDCCLPVYRILEQCYPKNRMGLHLKWRCAGPITEIRVRRSLSDFPNKNNITYYTLYCIYDHWDFYLFRKHLRLWSCQTLLSTTTSFAQGLRLRIWQGRKKRSKPAKVAWKVRKRNGIRDSSWGKNMGKNIQHMRAMISDEVFYFCRSFIMCV